MELLSQELIKCIGKKIILYLKNSFRYEGTLINVDTDFISLYDVKSCKNKLIRLDSIAEVEHD